MNKRKKLIKKNLTWYSFIIIPLATLLIFTYIPTATTIFFSFTDMETYGTDYNIIGLKNYRSLLTSSGFMGALKNTILLSVYSFLKIPIGFILAYGINSLGRTKKQSFFRVMFYLPNIITGVCMIVILKYVLASNGGLLNMVLSAVMGREITIGWLSDPSISHVGATIIDIWMGVGYYMLMCLASLQSIPTELYDAASVDGAKNIKKLFYITIPQMKACFSFLFVTSMISGFARFTDLFILSGNSPAGRPSGTLQTLLMFIYQYSFETPKYGISSAGAVILFVLTMIFALINVKMSGFFKEED